ncbi:MAG: ABC transporter ATP-binding protein [Proteobacteria bacterium]|nr:ABC transporter ATP-binding protein [Pseudomonadota bacterium]
MMNALEIKNLEKTYANGLHALKGIDLQVDEADFFALLGPNGAGKSTTIGIISSLVNKNSGKISIFGFDLDMHISQVKSCLGIVPQELNFSQFETCQEIVLNQAGYYGIKRHVALKRAEKYLGELGLWDRRHDISRTLSGGLKRRLMIARALINEPRMLILDEPTAGVDVELRRSMWDFLKEINSNGTTILLTTHYLEEAENLCKNIAIIDKGLIIEHTSMRQLLGKLNIETFVLDLEAPVSQLPSIDKFTLRLIDPLTIEADLIKGNTINELFYILTKHNIRVSSMRNKSSRLEELFIRLLNI